MLCSRSANLISTTRTSVTMASSILRTFSAWRSSRLANWILSILVTPSTMCATWSPKLAAISSLVAGVSSTESCSRPAAMAVESSFISASTSATSSGWMMYGSPEARVCPAWCCTQKSHALRMSETSSLSRLACTWRNSFSKRWSMISWVILGFSTTTAEAPAARVRFGWRPATIASPAESCEALTLSAGEECRTVAMLHYRPLLFNGHRIPPAPACSGRRSSAARRSEAEFRSGDRSASKTSSRGEAGA